MERRKFLGTAGMLIGSSVIDQTKMTGLVADQTNNTNAPGNNPANPHSLDPCLPSTGRSWAPSVPTFSPLPLQLDPFAQHATAQAQPADFVIGFSETAINKLLVAHYKNNPDFYDRSREKNPNSPVFEYDFDDHGSVRKIKLWAKVVQDHGKAAVTVQLIDDASVNSRFAAWWRCQHGAQAMRGTGALPQNVNVLVPRVILQLNFPKLDGSGGENQVDLWVSVSIFAYLKIDQASNGDYELKLINWDIQSTPNDDPLDPQDPIWGKLKPGCESVEVPLRLSLRDALVVGTEILLANLSKTLTAAIPLPPINVVSHLSLVPRDLYVQGHSLAVTAMLSPSALSAKVQSQFRRELEQFDQDLITNETDLDAVLAQAPVDDPKALDKYMLQTVPAYQALDTRHKTLLAFRSKAQTMTSLASAQAGPLPPNDFFVMLGSDLFDKLAKSILVANAGDCTPWLTVDIGVAYFRGRACYWFNLSNAHGGLNQTTISMGADVRAGGGLELEACARTPCGDKCATWSPGIGLKGPLTLNVHVDGFSWSGNKALLLSADFSQFPGFEVYGLPPGVDDIVNAVLNFLSSVALKAFFNSILSMVHFPLIVVPLKIPQANVNLTLKDFGVANSNNMLVLTGTTDFS
jgi:hypothetical protein